MPTTTSSSITLRALLAELIQMPTLTDQKATGRAAIDWVKYQLRGLPLHIHDQISSGYSSVVFTTRPTKRPKVLLMSHLDVSPAPIEAFALKHRDGRYTGRGVFDMKYAVASYIKVLRDLGPQALAGYDLGLMLTTDEETTGGLDGAAKFAASGWGGGVIINPDAVGDWQIQRAAKGFMRFRLFSAGLAGHGSRPWEYRNAVVGLMAFFTDLQAQFPAEPCGDPEHGHSSLNIGIFNGGELANQVPATATAEIDMRYMPGQTGTQLEALLAETQSRHPGVTYERIVNYDPVSIKPTSPYVRKLSHLITEVTGVTPALSLSHGGSESGHFTAHGMPVLMFGPPGSGHHSDDEWIDAQGVEDFAVIIRRFLDEMAR